MVMDLWLLEFNKTGWKQTIIWAQNGLICIIISNLQCTDLYKSFISKSMLLHGFGEWHKVLLFKFHDPWQPTGHWLGVNDRAEDFTKKNWYFRMMMNVHCGKIKNCTVLSSYQERFKEWKGMSTQLESVIPFPLFPKIWQEMGNIHRFILCKFYVLILVKHSSSFYCRRGLGKLLDTMIKDLVEMISIWWFNKLF